MIDDARNHEREEEIYVLGIGRRNGIAQ
jgi:hypothetical protein